MRILEWCLLGSALLILYTYVGYPFVLWLLTRSRRRAPVQSGSVPTSFSIILPVRDEESRIATRVAELAKLVSTSGAQGEILVISDGSTDRTVERAQGVDASSLRVIDRHTSSGKAECLNVGARASTAEILVLADVRQTWAPDAIPRMLERFRDPQVGAVSGDLHILEAEGALAGVGLYWRYEKWIRNMEGQFESTVGVTGSISAVRRTLFSPMPPGTILDDVYWPLEVARCGYRVVHEPGAKAFDRLPPSPGSEFRRKVRTLCGNFQLMALKPQLLSPISNRLWWQLVSRKMLRLLVPWLLLLILVGSFLLPGIHFRLLLAAQALVYGLGLWSLARKGRPSGRLANVLGSFLVLNTAAWVAFWVWATGRSSSVWNRVNYTKAAGRHPAA